MESRKKRSSQPRPYLPQGGGSAGYSRRPGSSAPTGTAALAEEITTPLEHDHYDMSFHLLAIRNTARFNEPVSGEPVSVSRCSIKD